MKCNFTSSFNLTFITKTSKEGSECFRIRIKNNHFTAKTTIRNRSTSKSCVKRFQCSKFYTDVNLSAHIKKSFELQTCVTNKLAIKSNILCKKILCCSLSHCFIKKLKTHSMMQKFCDILKDTCCQITNLCVRHGKIIFLIILGLFQNFYTLHLTFTLQLNKKNFNLAFLAFSP